MSDEEYENSVLEQDEVEEENDENTDNNTEAEEEEEEDEELVEELEREPDLNSQIEEDYHKQNMMVIITISLKITKTI